MNNNQDLETGFKPLLRRAIFLPIIFMSLLALVTVWQIKQYSAASSWINHTSQVQLQVIQIQNALIDMETGMRGYLLSKDPKFLEPFHTAQAKIGTQASLLSQMVSDNPPQAERIKGLSRSIHRWEDYANAQIREMAQEPHFPGPRLEEDPGKVQMDGLRRQIGDVLGEETHLMKVRTERLAEIQTRTYLIILSIIFGYTGLLAFFSGRNLLSLLGIYQIALDSKLNLLTVLNQEQEFTSAVLETVGSPIVVLDHEGRIVRFNHSGELATGYSHIEVEGKLIFDLLIPEDERETVREVFRRLQMGQFPNQHENHWLTKSGSLRLFAWSNTAIPGKRGEVQYVIGTGMDISERKRRDEDLRESERKYRELFETMQESMFVVEAIIDSEGRPEDWCYLEVNPPAERLMELRREQMIGRKYSETVLKPSSEWIAVLGKVATTSEPVTQEIFAPSHNRWFYLTAYSPRPGQAAALLNDITERKRAEEALRANEDRLRLLVESVKDHASFMLDPDGNVLDWNIGAERLMGYAASEIIGQNFSCFYPEEERRQGHPHQLLQRALANGHAEEEGWRVRRVGSQFWANVLISPIYEKTGTLRGFAKVVQDFTERKRAQEELSSTLERLKKVLEVETVGVLFWDLSTGCMTDANDTFLKLMGYDRHDIETRELTWQKLTPPEFMEVSLAEIRKFQASGRVGPYEKEYFRKDGTKQWLLFAGSSLGGKSCVEFCVDISPRKKTEAALRESEEKFRTLADNISQLAWMTDEKGWIFWYNQRWYDYTGNCLEEMEGWGWKKVLHPDHVNRVVEKISHCFASGEPWEDTFPIRSKDGEWRWFLSRAQPIRDNHGSIARWFGTNTDITEELRVQEEFRKVEQSLRESEGDFRALANLIPQMVWTANSRGEINYNNDRWYQFTGLSPDQALGNAWLPLVHPDDQDRIVQKWMQAVSAGENYEIEIRFKRKSDQQYRWILVRAIPVKDEQGQVTKWFGTNTDIHEQKRIAAELTAAVKARDEFLSIASHELKTPLSSLKLQAQLQKKSIEKGHPDAYVPARINKMVNQMDRQVSRLVRLVDDMLDVSRIESGKFVIQLEKVVFSDIVKDVVDRLKPQMLAAGTEPVLECMEAIEGSWDCFRMEQVVTNLLTNAMRYGKGKPVRIRVERQGSDGLRMSVSDEGMGVSKENQERIFDRFERAVSANEVSGLGLGLFISREIVKLHGGTMWVKSELDQGATFFVDLPLEAPKTMRESA